MNVIDVHELGFTYTRAEKPSLDGVTFSVERGEFLGILGPSGSGKSTLCLTLNGIIPNSIHGEFKGEVRIKDPLTGEEYLTTETPVPQLSTVVGLVLQNPESQLFNMTVEDEVAFALENLGLPREAIAERVEWALKVAGLSGLEKEFPPNLSGGEQQRLAIASILAMKPPILVLDEPTSQLDPRGKREVLSLVSRLNREEGMTVIMVDHDTNFLLRNADRLIVMESGRILMEGSPRELAECADELERVGIKLPAAVKVAREIEKRGLLERTGFRLEDALSWPGYRRD